MNILTKDAVHHLLDTYTNHGGDAARALAAKYGIRPVYVKKLAVKHGVKAKPRKPRKIRVKRGCEPKWQWAIDRGAVIA